jgi:TatA/E family protein of Tat protein translocase
MGSLGMQEIIVIFVIALIVFGPRKLPELGKSLGKGLAEFKRASNELKQTWEDEVRLDKEKEQVTEILKDSTITKSDILGDGTSNSAGSQEVASQAGSKEIQ